jgi:uncharacterized YigZ family protein
VKQTVAAACRYEGERVKGSRFIVDIVSVASESDAHDALSAITDEFADASHHCWAWRIATPSIDRASDDGEPSGSAGRPILARLAGRNLVDTAAIVTRYFGGTKLGVGGLVRAYGGAVDEALDTMRLFPWIEMCEVRFGHQYSHTDAIERLVGETNGIILDRFFGESVTLHLRLPIASARGFAAALADLTAGMIVLTNEDNGLPN